uniref:CRAL-TRIO domain-containing protein n=1 Tax=Mycena chlorophos TaxID=658473 RepID=A0ABQ0L0W8_MYCCL|nr:predicted protein [Mycena chlorophos]
MVPINTLLEENIAIATRFLSELTKYEPSPEEEIYERLGTTTDDTDIVELHGYFHEYADNVRKNLLSLSKPSEIDPTAMSGKHAWERLVRVHRSAGDPAGYVEVVVCVVARAETWLTSALPNKSAVHLFCVSKIDAKRLDTGVLMYHIPRPLSPIYHTRAFDVVIDCTAFMGIAELPLQWLNHFRAELTRYDFRTRFINTHSLNSNTLTPKYTLYNFAARLPFCPIRAPMQSPTRRSRTMRVLGPATKSPTCRARPSCVICQYTRAFAMNVSSSAYSS